MPHAGLMNADELGPEAAALMQARLHIRGGKRRLRQGKTAAGIVTLYDALTSATEWFLLSAGRRTELLLKADDDLNNDKTVFNVLVRSGVIGREFDYEAFDRIVEKALHENLADYNYTALLEGIEAVMMQLGVLPFDESTLPPEDPSTY
ncbi:MAG TPA: hypothetical protein VJW95_00420 [Dissulfurispiraceae bacterium]|nr:hypothetical protein [Dissulfurispiraceae bacterium]